MKTKDSVLKLLTENAGAYLSGEELAQAAYVTRAAVWKAIKTLREEGYAIDAVTNRGYRLKQDPGALDAARVQAELKKHGIDIPVIYEAEVGSTNDAAEQYARAHGAGKPCLFLAGRQTAGRGRRGRSFHSPADTGVYLSLLWYPAAGARLTDFTAYAAVAVADAVDAVAFAGRDTAEIKWVNDIFLSGRKVAGILTEAHSALEEGEAPHVVVGVGVNLFPPAEGFPKELEKTAGSVFGAGAPPVEDAKTALIAAIVRELCAFASGSGQAKEACLAQYRKKSFLIGKTVRIAAAPPEKRYAAATAILPDYRLAVRYEDGTEEALSSGEVSVAGY
ncbi:MAG: biotin--[acetyl-CoA-carboxylase] ligase [Clostridia bacterium]|nr:biotin--[acetyl-CoA-carboxylase] ligase [Clostridia bacterium]